MVHAGSNGVDPSRDAVIATILDGERERREAMWQMAREMFRLGETLERQQLLLSQLLERVVAGERALLVPPREPALPADREPPGGSRESVASSILELEALREELARERELVERLRRSKLDIERRAAEAEARLSDPPRPSGGSRSLLDRLITRDRP